MTHDDDPVQVQRVILQRGRKRKPLPDVGKTARPATARVTGAPVLERPDRITRLRKCTAERKAVLNIVCVEPATAMDEDDQRRCLTRRQLVRQPQQAILEGGIVSAVHQFRYGLVETQSRDTAVADIAFHGFLTGSAQAGTG